MAANGNEVAATLETQIRESVDRLVADIRSTIDDVRYAVNQQLEAALQSVQADANAVTFRPILDRALGDLSTGSAPVAAAEPPPPRVVADAGRVKRSIQAVERGKSQVEVLNALLDEVTSFGSRAALLILKGDTFAGWKGAGFAAYGGNDDQIKRFTAAPGSVTELDQTLRSETVVQWDGGSLASKFNAEAPARAVLVPMVIKDKIAAAMYVDVMPGDEEKFDRHSIELLVFTTGLLIDTLAIRKKIPSPSLSASEEGVEAPAAPARPAPAPAPSPAPSQPAAATPSSPPPTFGGTVAIPGLSLATDPEATGSRRAAPAATTAMPAFTPAAPAAPPRPAAGSPAGPGGDDRPSTQYVPPAGVRGGFGAALNQSEEGKKHDEARRFARLLVSEIKLYNESKVEQGRRNKDLYERLKEDIDRSRQMYDERIAEDVRKSSNYFYDELVRILADGDAEALGL